MNRNAITPAWPARNALWLLLVTACASAPARAQPAPVPHETVPFTLASEGASNAADQAAEVFVGIVASPDAPWLRVHIRDYRLGPASCIVLTSLLDGATQRLDARSLLEWHRGSAFFNGDAVSVALRLAPGDVDAFVAIDRMTVGRWAGGEPQARFLCGADDRVASSESRIGRLVPVGCTGWGVSNGAFLTAGHCAAAGLDTLEFNVPPSQCDGTIVHPPPEDQYPATVVDFWDNGRGRDWAVFSCGANSNTGLHPILAQGFYRMSIDHAPSFVRVTGCGLDQTPLGCTGGFNAQSQTLQEGYGQFLGETVAAPAWVELEYYVDTEGGVSGSPVIHTPLVTHTLGIHTHGYCGSGSAGNLGTGFENDRLETALQAFPGTLVRYVDSSHLSGATRDGGVFRPYPRVVDAVAAVPDGGIVSIVAGSYSAASGNVFTAGADGRAMTLQAPVGLVRIGN